MMGENLNLKNISSIEITRECLSLISSMTMGSNEYSEFLKLKINSKMMSLQKGKIRESRINRRFPKLL